MSTDRDDNHSLHGKQTNPTMRGTGRPRPKGKKHLRVVENAQSEPGEGTEGLSCHSTQAAGNNTGDESKSAKRSQVDRLLALAENLDLFHGPDGAGYADFVVDGHRETWSVRSKGCRDWLRRSYYADRGSAPNGEALKSAVETLDARAQFDGVRRDVFLRVGQHEGSIYLDLADREWRAVEIGPKSWRVVARPPVRFRRPAGMLPLPAPQTGASLEALRPFLNVEKHDFDLVVAWIEGALRPSGPYPVLAVNGEQGSAKSTCSAMVRALVDPNDTPLRSLPREDRDLFIAAHNAHTLAFDNISGLPAWLADSLCRLATGGGFAIRQLFSDTDEVRFNGQRPVVLNGIEDASGRPDLADRSIFLTLKAIPDEKRRTEGEMWAGFERERTQIMGALLDAMSSGLRRLPSTKLARLPRMADFALWGTACEVEPGAFMAAYDGNRAGATALIVEHDAVAHAVRQLSNQCRWRGTATELLEALFSHTTEAIRRAKDWPQSPRALSGRLRRVATMLRNVGVVVKLDQREGDKSNARLITIELVPEGGKLASEPSEPSDDSADHGDSFGRKPSADGARQSDGTQTDPASDGRGDRSFDDNALAERSFGRSEGSDANSPCSSASDHIEVRL